MRVLATAALGFSAGVLLSVCGLPAGVGLICGAVLALAGLLTVLLRRMTLRRMTLVCFGLAAGLIWTQIYSWLFLAPAQTLTGDARTLWATVIEYPSETAYGCAVTVRLSDGETEAKAALYLDAEAMELETGDMLRVTARVQTADAAGSDYQKIQGVFLVAYGDGYEMVTKYGAGGWRYFPAYINHAVQERIRAIFPEDTAPLLLALLTGEKGELSDAAVSDMKTAGDYHAVAISGMHVSILVGFLSLLIRRKRRRALVGIPVVLSFLLIIGNAPGVTRASIMQIIVLSAALLQREYDAPTALGVAAVVMLLQNPWAAVNTGAQLSFASTAGILLCASRIYSSLSSEPLPRKLLAHQKRLVRVGRSLRNAAAASLSTSLGALVFSTPLMAYYFGTVSLVSILTNLVALWSITACFALGLAAVVLSVVLRPLGTALAWVCGWPARYFLWVTALMAKLPFASVSVSSPYILAWLAFLYVLALILLFAKEKQRARKRPLVPLCAAVLTLGVCLLLSAVSYTSAGFSFSVLDVGQGQCLVLYTEGVNVMIDCGGDGNAGETAAQFLTANGQMQLDVLMLTHFDSDHCNGVTELLRRIPTAALYVPQIEDDSGNRQKILAAAAEYQVPVYAVTEDTTLIFGESGLQIFAPVSTVGDNEACLSALFTYGEFDVLVTGDMDLSAEARLLRLHSLPDIELLVVGHHGSKYATGETLLETVRPELAVISVGADNHYGHPTQETLDRLTAAGAQIYRTDECGTVTIRR